MDYQLIQEPSTGRPGRAWLLLLLGIGFILSLMIGLAALSSIFVLPLLEEEQTAVTDPFVLVQPERIPPHLALLELAGAEGEALSRQATTADERALAYAILLYNGELSDARRAEDAVRLGVRFLKHEDPARAAAAFHRARSVAVFSHALPPLERGQLFARVAEGLAAVGDEAAALDAGLQAQHVAAQAADLLPAQRAELLESVAPLIRELGSPEDSRRLDELLRSPGRAPQRVGLVSQLSTLSAAAPAPPTVQEAVIRRQDAAQKLIDRILLSQGQDIEPERVALAQALLAEDQARRDAYAALENTTLPIVQYRAAVLDYRNWLLRKLRLAEGAFGLHLAPGWESEVPAIRAELAQVAEALVQASLTAADERAASPEADPVAGVMLRLEVLRWLALQAELGFHPNAPLGNLATEIESAQSKLETLGAPPDLPVFYDPGATPPGFRIARRYE